MNLIKKTIFSTAYLVSASAFAGVYYEVNFQVPSDDSVDYRRMYTATGPSCDAAAQRTLELCYSEFEARFPGRCDHYFALEGETRSCSLKFGRQFP